MKVTKEKTENSQAFLSIELEPAEVETGLAKAYQRVVKKVNIPGFRKGKAPRALVERYVGKERMLEEALDDLIPETYERAVREQDLTPFSQPQIELTTMEPVVYKATVPLPPTVGLGDYQSIKVEPVPSDYKEEAVDHVIEQMRHQNAVWEPAERPAASGDIVTIDIKSDVEGKPFVNTTSYQYQLELDSTFPLAGFATQMVGVKRNDEKEFKLSIPADYRNTEFAGKEAIFHIKVNEIKQEKLPEVNEEFVKTVAPECENLAALRERVIKELKARAEERARLEYEEKVIQAAVDISKVEYPPVIVEREIDRLLNQQLQYLQMSGVNIEDYMKALKKTPDEMRVDLKPRAEKRVTQTLVLQKIAEVEKTEVSDAETAVEIDNTVASYPTEQQVEMRRTYSTTAARETVKSILQVRKATQRLIDIAKSSYTKTEENALVATPAAPEKEAKDE